MGEKELKNPREGKLTIGEEVDVYWTHMVPVPVDALY